MRRDKARLALLWVVTAALATVLPLLLASWGAGTSWIAWTYKDRLPFELFGLTGAVFLATVVLSLRNLEGSDFRRDPRLLVVVLLVGSLLLILVSEISSASIDYHNYHMAAEAIAKGRPLYEKTGYVYPPLFAQVLAVMSSGIQNLFSIDSKYSSKILFYLYQSSQFFLAFAAFGLCWSICRRFTSDLALLAAVLASLFLVNDPLFRNIRFNQINLVLLDLILVGIVLLPKFPVSAGILFAVGVHLKLYPLLLALPLLLARRVRPVVGMVLGGAGIFAAQIAFGGANAWRQFLVYSKDPTTGTALRDSSIHSLIYNTGRILGLDLEARKTAVTGLYLAFVAVALGWLIWRQQQRLRADASLRAVIAPETVELMIFETMAFTLLMSPLVWAHHFVLLLPFAAVGFFSLPAKKRPAAVLWLALIFAIPTFDLYPLSYHRLVGLLGFLVLTRPVRTTGAVRPAAEDCR